MSEQDQKIAGEQPETMAQITTEAAAVQIVSQEAAQATEEQKTQKQIFEEKKKAWQGKKVVQVQKVDENGDVIDEDQVKDATQDAEDAKEESAPIKFTVLGSEDCPVSADDTEVEFAMSYRIPKIEGLDQCTQLTYLGLRKNLIKKIEGLENCTQLQEIELYDNRIRHIENLSHLQNLVFLDLSYNRIREIQGLEELTGLTKIYLSANRIRKMQNLSMLTNLTILDVGDNKIRKIEGIETLTNLTEFHAAKNKLTKIEGLETLTNLVLIAMQANFIQEIQGLDTLLDLEELYLQQNQIPRIENLQNNSKLCLLDIAMNKVTKFENLEHLTELRDLWMNWNFLEDTDENKNYLRQLRLTTIYLADNPMSMHDDYQQMLTEHMPTLTQIDGNQLRSGNPFHHQRTVGIHPIVKKPVNPEAQKLLDSVLQQSQGANTVPQTIVMDLTNPDADITKYVATVEEEKKE